MPEGVDASANVTAGTGLGLNYVQDRVYAYSGKKDGGSGVEVSFLLFTTGTKTIKGKFQCFYSPDTAQATSAIYRIKFNDQIISQYWDKELHAGSGDANPQQPVHVIIPPLTLVEVTIEMDNGAQLQTVIFTGKTL